MRLKSSPHVVLSFYAWFFGVVLALGVAVSTSCAVRSFSALEQSQTPPFDRMDEQLRNKEKQLLGAGIPAPMIEESFRNVGNRLNETRNPTKVNLAPLHGWDYTKDRDLNVQKLSLAELSKSLTSGHVPSSFVSCPDDALRPFQSDSSGTTIVPFPESLVNVGQSSRDERLNKFASESHPLPDTFSFQIQGHASFYVRGAKGSFESILKLIRNQPEDGLIPHLHAARSLINSNQLVQRKKSKLYDWMHEFCASQLRDSRGIILRDFGPVRRALGEGLSVHSAFALFGDTPEGFWDRAQVLQSERQQTARYSDLVLSLAQQANAQPVDWILDEYIRPLAQLTAEQRVLDDLQGGNHMQNVLIAFKAGKFERFILRDAYDLEFFELQPKNSQKFLKKDVVLKYLSQSIWLDMSYPLEIFGPLSRFFVAELRACGQTLTTKESCLGSQAPNQAELREGVRMAFDSADWSLVARDYQNLAANARNPSMGYTFQLYNQFTLTLRDADELKPTKRNPNLSGPTPGKILKDALSEPL